MYRTGNSFDVFWLIFGFLCFYTYALFKMFRGHPPRMLPASWTCPWHPGPGERSECCCSSYWFSPFRFSRKAKTLSDGKRLFSFRNPIFSRRRDCMSGRFRKEGQMLPKRDFHVAVFRSFLKKDTELFDKMYVQNSREASWSRFHASARFLGRCGVQPFDKNAQKVFPNVFFLVY